MLGHHHRVKGARSSYVCAVLALARSLEMTNTLRDLKKRKGKRRAAPRRFKLQLPASYSPVPGRDGKTLTEKQIEGWGACHGCGTYGHFVKQCPQTKKLGRKDAGHVLGGRVLDGNAARAARLARLEGPALIEDESDDRDDECLVCMEECGEAERCVLHGDARHWTCWGCAKEHILAGDCPPCPVCNCELDADALRAAIPADETEEGEPPTQSEEEQRKRAKSTTPAERTSRSRGRATAASASSRDSPKHVETLFDQSDSCPGTWYKGIVRDYDVAEGKHLVVYEDGDQQWLNLEEEHAAQQLRWLS